MKQALIFLALLIFKNIHGQNIVPNGSFEDVNICPEFHQPCSPSGWFYINHLVRGYFNSSIKPIRGDKDLTLVVVDTASSNRDYWQTMLLCPLEPGKNYKVSLKLASENIGPNLHDIGLYFTDSFLFIKKDSMIQPMTYLNFLNARIKKLKHGWLEVQKEFTATSANHFLIIGNFSDKTNRQIANERAISIKRLYLSVDDLTIISTDEVSCPEMQKIKDSLYSIKERHSHPQFQNSPIIKPEMTAQKKIDTVITSQPKFQNSPIIKPEMTVQKKIDTVIINNIEFDFDSYQIKNSNMLQYLRNYLSDTAIKKIKITGFTDNTGSIQYNKSLSEKRAKAVAYFLVKAFGLKEYGIEVEGQGVSAKYAKAQQNRRVEISIYVNTRDSPSFFVPIFGL